MMSKKSKSSYQYESIVGSEDEEEQSSTSSSSNASLSKKRRSRQMALLLLVLSVGSLALIYGTGPSTAAADEEQDYVFALPFLWGSSSSSSSSSHKHKSKHKHSSSSSRASTSTTAPNKIPMPHGVNFGSWLSLEDYFYVGETGAVEVATPNQNVAAICLPPLHLGQAGAPDWQSETDLLTSLIKTTGGVANAIKIFHAHRTSFITEHDLEALQKLGIKHVRVPLSWCFTDSDPETDITPEATDEQLLDMFTCADPFYQDEGVRWSALPRTLLARFLRQCANYGITASLDLHTYPGATSPGTFSGLWPRKPRFWEYDDPLNSADYGRRLYHEFIAWVEQLDRDALDGIMGISPMNEPAHLAGVFKDIPSLNYLPPLPDAVAQQYLAELKQHSDYPFLNGPHLRVFLWLRDAVQVFRESTLPGLGLQLHMNLHESLLSEDYVYGFDGDHGGRGNPASHKLIAAWWSQTTHHHEREHWAVLDIHHYHAWSPSCNGAVDGPPAGNYSCGDIHGRNKALQRCTEWANDIYRAAVDEMCGKGAKLMSGEFSTSTHHRVRHACNDIDTLKAMYMMQMDAAHKADVDMYYWSYKMPHGGAFRNAWSFKELMYLLGVTDRPDRDNFNCGEHMTHPDEVTDDIFTAG